MPATAKLSRRFYEQFGDEIANELVEWFNSVDATYRADLRELNELAGVRTGMQRWMLASWSTMTLVLLGTLFAVLRTH
jgi:hypothetical protein